MTRIELCNLSALTAMPKTEMKATTGGHGQHDKHRGDSHKYYRYCGRFGRRYPWWMCQFGRFGR